MQLLAQYPITEQVITPYIGRPVVGMLNDGEVVYGVFDRIHQGNLVLRPITGIPEAAVSKLKKSVKSNSKSKAAMKKMLPTVKTSALGFGYPYGYAYGNWGWGLGAWLIWPLLALTALFAFPFLI